ncbi:F-box domain containing protein [Ophiocordyceps sinensis CO18]|uniref:F-box domain containing protein n=1 Tax=Ophiocordyceps sinensis (strain Co18 / CGMCC 3.14243) TaxID=911162 RepID=T5AKG6_OPHSC|nr:F-box domain containing protein [Ophiocordyceps sinensis CO18]
MALKRRLSRREPDGDDQDDALNDRLSPAKRHRVSSRDVLSTLSDELVVRILSFMEECVLLAISPVSRRFHRIASDSQLWRRHYYRRFILPRAHRIPGFPDGRTGLRAWDLKTRKLIAQTRLAADGDVLVPPTCLAVDDQRLAAGVLDISAGFHDGTFGVWRLDVGQGRLTLLFRQIKSYLGQLVAIAYVHPYVLTATSLGFISLYTFDFSDDEDWAKTDATRAESIEPRGTAAGRSTGDDLVHAPYQLTSLKSHSTRSPLALSLRKTATSVVASIVYTFDSIGGWAIGIQDLDIHQSSGRSRPDVVNSRVAYTLPTRTRKSATPSPESTPTRSPSHVLDSGDDGPVRLCYSHPYLLATLPDNCMVLHLCTSTATALTISPGIRLWGHTSGISDAEITPRGKAVSVSTRGDEIRLWELEGRVGGSSVEVRPRPPTDGGGDGRAGFHDCTDLTDRKNWVGFDNEMVVVLKEAQDGRESLVVYDFT